MPWKEPSYGDGSSRQLAPSSSERNRRPASAPRYMRPGGPRAIAFRWNSKPRSTSASISSAAASTFVGAGERRRLERHLAPDRAAVAWSRRRRRRRRPRRRAIASANATSSSGCGLAGSKCTSSQESPPSCVRRIVSTWPTAQPCLSSAKYTAVRLALAGNRRLGPGAAGDRPNAGCGRARRPRTMRGPAQARSSSSERDGERRDDRGPRGRVLRRRVLGERRRRHREGERREREPQACPGAG